MQLVKFCDIIEIAQLGWEKFSFGNFGFAPPNNNVLATALQIMKRKFYLSAEQSNMMIKFDVSRSALLTLYDVNQDGNKRNHIQLLNC